MSSHEMYSGIAYVTEDRAVIDKLDLCHLVGMCAEEAASWCVFTRPISKVEMAARVIHLFDHPLALLRSASPCHCVLNNGQYFCVICNLTAYDLVRQKKIHLILMQTVIYFYFEMFQWEEYKEDVF